MVVGQSVTFSVTAAGTSPFTYQWYKNSAVIAGATAATYTISSVQTTDAGNYYAIVSNSAGSTTSDTATLTVNPAAVAPAITTQPVSQTVLTGASVTFTAAASGTPTPTYQWQYNGANISGATSASYTIASVATGNAGTYTMVATNSAGSATSSGAVLTVNAVTVAPTITTQPASQTVSVGASVTFTAAANGTPTPTYQWQKNGANISGATSASYTIASVATGNAGTYTMVATNSAGSATSSGAVLTVNAVTVAPTITTQPASQTVSVGASVTFTAAANGTPTPTYQWQKNGANISGATSASYTIASVATGNAGTYTMVATNSAGSATSSGAMLTVKSSTNQGGGSTTVITEPLTVSTLAGQALTYGSADGTGSGARFYYPAGVAADNAGNLYIADTDNHTIREIVAATGAVNTLAGLAGVSGSADGTGSAARFNSPSGVAVDGSGNVYVADTLNNTVREVTPSGVVSTLAGTPGSSGSMDGTGAAALFNGPQGLAIDSAGILYVADTNNDTIRKVVLTTGGVTTIAGLAGSSGSADGLGSAARFNAPLDVAVDTAGNLYVADADNDTIREILPSGQVSTLAGLAGNSGAADGTGSAARFNSPSAVAVDLSGNVYVADTDNFTIRMLVPVTGQVSTLAGLAGTSGSADGAGSAALFFAPAGIAVDSSGNLYIADTDNDTIRLGLLAAAPAIQAQPQSQTVPTGSSALFSVTATGHPALTYQWYFNGAAISGATASSYSLASAQSGNAGSYTVTVTNAVGSVTSNPATLAVNTVTSQLSNVSTGSSDSSGGGGGGGAPSWWFLLALVLIGTARWASSGRLNQLGECD